MTPLRFNEIKGNWATLVLPINCDNSIDYDLLAHEIDLLISMGVDGIYSTGSTGEFFNLTEREYDICCELLANKCNSAAMNFQIGASHMSPIISLERLKRAKPLNPSAFQVILPDWFCPTLNEAIVFLEKMEMMADGIGLVLYNPPQAKKQLKFEEIRILKKAIDGLVGLKLAGGDLMWYQDMKDCNQPLSFFIPGHQLATGIKFGAFGSYSNMACLNPLAAQIWYEMTLVDLNKAFELEKRINLFIDKYIVPLIISEKYSNMAVDKFLTYLGGWSGIPTRMRWPYRSIDSNVVKRIKPFGQQLIPEFFSS